MPWSVGQVVHAHGTDDTYSFSIVNEHRAPLVTLTYATGAEAMLARSVIHALLAGAVDLISHPDPTRG
jgi:hypothetical protein